jgi:formylmethanofuran dehydrogenase subunit C
VTQPRLRFLPRAEPDRRLDLSPLTPERLAGLSVAEIEALPLCAGRHPLSVADIFAVRAGDASEIVIEGGSHRFDRVGAAMRQGSLHIAGDVGQQAGRAMAGGRLAIGGSAGGWAGSGLIGGAVEIAGDAGDWLGGPLPGERSGMRGGTIVVRGHAGIRAGDRMRRGLVIVEGDAGPHAASAMIAGTLVVCGGAGPLPGILMRRGTIVLGRPAALAPSFLPTGGTDLVFTRLLAQSAATFSATAASCIRAATIRHAGDLAALGKGEVFSR